MLLLVATWFKHAVMAELFTGLNILYSHSPLLLFAKRMFTRGLQFAKLSPTKISNYMISGEMLMAALISFLCPLQPFVLGLGSRYIVAHVYYFSTANNGGNNGRWKVIYCLYSK